MDRRTFGKSIIVASASLALPSAGLQARERIFLTLEQARAVMWGDTPMEQVNVSLSEAQMDSIQDSSETRVRSSTVNAWKTEDGGWFIVDQVIGKHENIDLAVGLTNEGKVKGIEILTYRETYGHEVADAAWRDQFTGRGHEVVLKLDEHIDNIAGATLSCRHVTDGVNRLTHTWDQVLRNL